MDTLTRNDLESLAGVSGGWCVSLYMPTHRAGRETRQDPIRLKNLSSRAKESLIEYGVRRIDAGEMMRPVDSLLSDAAFWQHQGDGLAVFISPGHFQILRLPVRFEELVVIGRRFHIKPLLPAINENGQFHVLAISLNGIRLFLGTRDGMTEVDLSEIPTSMDEVLYMDDPEKHLDFRTGAARSGGQGDRAAVFHGHGTQSDEENKKNILRFFQYVNKELANVVEDKSIPMVLAGVEYLLPIYREANTYPTLVGDSVEGSPERMGEEEMHQSAWRLVKPIFEADQVLAIERLERLKGTRRELVVSEITDAVMAAIHGGIDTLFIPLGVQKWGRYVRDENQVMVEDTPSQDNEDLIDLAAQQTLLNSGQVFTVQPDELPDDTQLAAILRYAI